MTAGPRGRLVAAAPGVAPGGQLSFRGPVDLRATKTLFLQNHSNEPVLSASLVRVQLPTCETSAGHLPGVKDTGSERGSLHCRVSRSEPRRPLDR